jgi:hypothetical protein
MITKNEKLIALKLMYFFLIENFNLRILRPPQRTHQLQEKPSALKRKHSALKNMKVLYFFVYLCIIFALLDPDPASSNSNECGSGFTTLLSSA